MAGSSFGNIFRITTWGESHGKALGVVVDGVPAGLTLSETDIQEFLDRRKPGQTSISTPRVEADQVEILSGVFEGRTTGTPISMLVRRDMQTIPLMKNMVFVIIEAADVPPAGKLSVVWQQAPLLPRF